jgi:hypothetical protein
VHPKASELTNGFSPAQVDFMFFRQKEFFRYFFWVACPVDRQGNQIKAANS